jgi:hypothetical protein
MPEAIINQLKVLLDTLTKEQAEIELEHEDEERDIDGWQEGFDEGFVSGKIELVKSLLAQLK